MVKLPELFVHLVSFLKDRREEDSRGFISSIGPKDVENAVGQVYSIFSMTRIHVHVLQECSTSLYVLQLHHILCIIVYHSTRSAKRKT